MRRLAIKVVRRFFNYIYLEGDLEEVISVLKYFKEKLGKDTEDLNDAIRILSNFDVFYDMMKRKFKDGLSPKKSERDLIAGEVIVDKIKLVKAGGKRAILIFDKRVNVDEVINAIQSLNLEFQYITQ